MATAADVVRLLDELRQLVAVGLHDDMRVFLNTVVLIITCRDLPAAVLVQQQLPLAMATLAREQLDFSERRLAADAGARQRLASLYDVAPVVAAAATITGGVLHDAQHQAPGAVRDMRVQLQASGLLPMLGRHCARIVVSDDATQLMAAASNVSNTNESAFCVPALVFWLVFGLGAWRDVQQLPAAVADAAVSGVRVVSSILLLTNPSRAPPVEEGGPPSDVWMCTLSLCHTLLQQVEAPPLLGVAGVLQEQMWRAPAYLRLVLHTLCFCMRSLVTQGGGGGASSAGVSSASRGAGSSGRQAAGQQQRQRQGSSSTEPGPMPLARQLWQQRLGMPAALLEEAAGDHCSTSNTTTAASTTTTLDMRAEPGMSTLHRLRGQSHTLNTSLSPPSANMAHRVSSQS